MARSVTVISFFTVASLRFHSKGRASGLTTRQSSPNATGVTVSLPASGLPNPAKITGENSVTVSYFSSLAVSLSV